MKSIFTKILLWSFATLLISLIAFVAISRILADRAFRRGEPFRNPLSAQAEQAQQAFESGGRKQLELYLEQLHTFFPDDHHLTDAGGTDVLTGENRSHLLVQARSQPGIPGFRRGGMVMATPTADGRYRFIAVIEHRPLDLWSFIPYYLLVLIAVALLCYMLATNLATPLRVLEQTVELFGKGNLSVRVNSGRQDEIGKLSRAFDQMADRIQTLLTAERRLLQDISHELRSPLARLSFAVELVRTADNREGAVNRLKKEIDRLTHLVGGLLQVTRVEGDPASLNHRVFSLNELLRELADDGAIEADVRGCRLVVKDEEQILVRADHELLRRAVENILRNAIRHAPEGTPIEIALDCQPSMVSVSSRDDGPGVPEEMLPSIFKPFFRVDGSRDSASGGAGLGLAIAMSAIALHRGNLSAINTHPGLLVRIELPGDLKVPTEDGAVVNIS